MNTTDSEILLQTVCYEDRGWCINQENQVGYDGGGTLILIAWIKFVAFKKHFSILSLVVISGSGKTLMYSGKCISQQSAVCKNSKLFDPQAQLEVHEGDTTRSGILFAFFTIQFLKNINSNPGFYFFSLLN